MHRFLVVSFFTPRYENGARMLRESLDALGIPHDIRAVNRSDQTGDDWQANVRFKPQFILDMMEAHKGDAQAIVWLDADAKVWRQLTLFSEITQDLGVFFLPTRKNFEELLSGTMYWKNCTRVRSKVQRWINAMKTAPKGLLKPEQQILQSMLSKLRLSVFKLPRSYCHIARRTTWHSIAKAPHIQHKQYSRQTRHGQDPEDISNQSTRPPKRTGRRPLQKPTAKSRRALAKARKLAFDPRSPEGRKRRRKLIYARRAQKTAATGQKRPHRSPPRPQAKSPAVKPLATAVPILPVPEHDGGHWEKSAHKEAYPPTGGLTRGTQTPAEEARAIKAMKQMTPASELDGVGGDTVVIMGNSKSLRKHDLTSLSNVFTVGCNRALLKPPQGFWPNAVLFGDREPYRQECISGRLHEATANGVAILCSTSIFDPRIRLSPRKSGPEFGKAQPPPSFKVYLFEYGPVPKPPGWTYDKVASGEIDLELNFDSFSRFIVTGQNVSCAILQTAAILGAKQIGCVGIELKWSGEEAHHYGRGKSVGAWEPDARSLTRILGSHKQAKAKLKKKGVRVFNLSPVKDSPFASVWGSYPYAKFVEEFCNG